MTLDRSHMIGIGVGVAVVAGVWLLWGRKAAKVARGEAASKRAWVKTARASVARDVAMHNRAVADDATMISKNNPALAPAAGSTMLG